MIKSTPTPQPVQMINTSQEHSTPSGGNNNASVEPLGKTNYEQINEEVAKIMVMLNNEGEFKVTDNAIVSLGKPPKDPTAARVFALVTKQLGIETYTPAEKSFQVFSAVTAILSMHCHAVGLFKELRPLEYKLVSIKQSPLWLTHLDRYLYAVMPPGSRDMLYLSVNNLCFVIETIKNVWRRITSAKIPLKARMRSWCVFAVRDRNDKPRGELRLGLKITITDWNEEPHLAEWQNFAVGSYLSTTTLRDDFLRQESLLRLLLIWLDCMEFKFWSGIDRITNREDLPSVALEIARR